MNTNELKTKICNKCARELPIEKYELMKPKKGKPYYLNTCKDCRYQYSRKLILAKKEVHLSDDIELLITREYKKISPGMILNISDIGIEALGNDEIFVRKVDYKNLWISNYGRAIQYTGLENPYRLLSGNYDKYGVLRYKVKRNIYTDGEWTLKNEILRAPQAVVDLFVVNPDIQNNIYIFGIEGSIKKIITIKTCIR